jgi:hypothetical protein
VTRCIQPLALLLALFLTTATAWAARPGEPAPEINLPRINGGQVSLAAIRAGGPVLVWFPEASSVSGQTGSILAGAAARNGATLLVIPVVGANPGPAQALADRFPNWLVLHDADGSVTLNYTGEFIPGISPRQNLFIVSTRGLITWSRFWPGVPEQTLDNELSTAR